MVRGAGAKLVEEFRTGGFVAIGWGEIGDIPQDADQAQIQKLVDEHYPGKGERPRGLGLPKSAGFCRMCELGTRY